MLEKALYRASAKATGGRQGRAVSSDGVLDLKLTQPKELGGAGGEGTNPEQLFAAGYAACFLSALKWIAHGEKITFSPDSSVESQVGIGPSQEAGMQKFELEVELKISLPGLTSEQAHFLVERAHATCPYSNATRNNIEVRLKVESS